MDIIVELTPVEHDVLLDEFLLNDEVIALVRHRPESYDFSFRRHCFDFALIGKPIDHATGAVEREIIRVARSFLIGYKLGKDLSSGVSKRYKALQNGGA